MKRGSARQPSLGLVDLVISGAAHPAHFII